MAITNIKANFVIPFYDHFMELYCVDKETNVSKGWHNK